MDDKKKLRQAVALIKKAAQNMQAVEVPPQNQTAAYWKGVALRRTRDNLRAVGNFYAELTPASYSPGGTR